LLVVIYNYSHQTFLRTGVLAEMASMLISV